MTLVIPRTQVSQVIANEVSSSIAAARAAASGSRASTDTKITSTASSGSCAITVS